MAFLGDASPWNFIPLQGNLEFYPLTLTSSSAQPVSAVDASQRAHPEWRIFNGQRLMLKVARQCTHIQKRLHTPV